MTAADPAAATPALPPALAACRDRLEGERPRIAIVGLGYVGLPLAMELSLAGAEVVGLDVTPSLCAALNAGRSHVGDVSDQVLAKALDRGFRATVDAVELATCDAVVICVPTPLSKTRDPDLSYILAAAEAVATHARPAQLVVLESTTWPGTTQEVLVPMLAERGLVAGQDIAVAFSPERVDPSNPRYGIRNTPKVVGGVTPACTAVVSALYRRCCDTIVPVSSTSAAETVKLLENVFRMVNIGLVNEFALICRELGLDVWEIIDAASTKPFGFMRFVPGPGLGGHCIPVDPHYLSWKLRSHQFPARFVELADAVNARMPGHVVDVVTEALNDVGRAVRGSRLLLLGLAYKRDVADVRESPALAVLEKLLERGAAVAVHDPLVAQVRLGEQVWQSVPLTDEELAQADCVVLLTDHGAFDTDRILAHSRLLVDTRNALRGAIARAPALASRVRRI
ncbi:nucleotide sugar dehydrogenase [Myxococcota bacterium]|nr:nucleotide sugar dehydrogenase [Myxococcota bacterium]